MEKNFLKKNLKKMKFTIFNLENQKSENIHYKNIQKIIVNNKN